MKKNKLLFIIISTVFLMIVLLGIIIASTTESPKEKYIKDIAYNISSMNTEFTVTTTFEPKYTDASIPEILEASRHYDSASAALVSSMHFKGVKKTNNGYETSFTASYLMSKEEYNSLFYWIEESVIPTLTTTGDYDRAKELHDYILLNCSAGDESSPSTLLKSNKTGNQQAYAITYKMLLDVAGIDCEYVYKNGYHWNIVKLDGMWFNVDVYRDDNHSSSNYDYFMKGRKNWGGYSGTEATSPYAYNTNNPAITSFLFYAYYAILHLGWPLATIAFIIILINRKKL